MEAINPEIVVSAPLFIEMGIKKKRRYYINLNQYRNWHYQVSNNLKKKYKEIITPSLEGLVFRKIKLELILYKASRRRIDRSNVLSIHEKFFCDAFVEANCLEDDCDDYLESSHYYTAGIDKNNPRVEIRIHRIQ